MDLLDRIAYDSGGYTVQEILSSFCKKILEIIDLVNKNEEVCDESRTIIENIRNEVVPDLVDDIMKELQDNGYFDSLVNVTLIEQLRTEITTLLNDTITNFTTRLDNFDSQLEENTKNSIDDILSIKSPQFETTKQPILVFVDDDTRKETYTYWHKLAKEMNVKISLACIPEWIEEGQSTTTIPPGKEVMTMEELKEMYDYGHDILAHGYDTRSIKEFLNNPTELKHQLYDCREWIKNNGFTRNGAYNYFVYPQGLTGTTEEILKTKAEVRKYYQYGINAFTTEKNVDGVFDSFNIPRVTGDNQSFETLKDELDKIIANKGMMIVLTHAWHSQDNDGGIYESWSNRYKQLINYARANNVKILPFSEAIKVKGNVISIGEFKSDNRIYINNDGSSVGLAPLKYIQSVSLSGAIILTELNSDVPINFTINDFSTINMYDQINRGFVIPKDGIYRVNVFYVPLTSANDNTIVSSIYVNEERVKFISQTFNVANKNCDASNSSVILNLKKNDVVQLRIKTDKEVSFSASSNSFYFQIESIN